MQICHVLILFLLLPSAAASQDIAMAMSAMVRISGTRGDASVRGSGFVVSLDHDKATIVTASHVIQGVQQIEVTFAADVTQSFPAGSGSVLGMDTDSPQGLAVFQVRGAIPKGVTALSFSGESRPHPGEALFLLGFPQMERTPRTAQRALAGQKGMLLLIDQASGEGFSGGPVLQGGKVVGVITSTDDQTTYAVNEAVAYEVLTGWGLKLNSRQATAQYEVVGPNGESLPGVMHFCGANCVTLVWTQGHYAIVTKYSWDPPGFSSIWVVVKFTRDLVILHRHDSQTPSSPKGGDVRDVTYIGQISEEGNRLINISSNGSRKNNAKLAWGSALNSVPGSDEERDARPTPRP
jgi:hypothetical protein